MQCFFAWDLPRNLPVKCIVFCTKFIPKNLYLAENSLYKKSLFLRETARGPVNMKMPTIVGIFIFISREIFMLSYVWQERICKLLFEIY